MVIRLTGLQALVILGLLACLFLFCSHSNPASTQSLGGFSPRGVVVEANGRLELRTGNPAEEEAFQRLAGYSLPQVRRHLEGFTAGRSALPKLKVASEPRLEYARVFTAPPFEGWCEPINGFAAAFLSTKQHCLGLRGTVGEIGVHKGLFWVTLAHTATEAERLFVCDVFDLQSKNVDKSGKGDKQEFFKNMKAYGINPRWVDIVEDSSLSLSPERLLNTLKLPRFRLFSVDGGHTFQITLADLLLASKVIIDGGLIVVDDIYNPEWMGVRNAVHFFFDFNFAPNLKPFAVLGNKLWITTSGYEEAYRDLVLSQRCLAHIRENSTLYFPGLWKSMLGGVEIPYVHTDRDRTMECWVEFLDTAQTCEARYEDS